MEGKRILVVSAHAADYVWRSGGTIAKYIKHGAKCGCCGFKFWG